MTKRLPTILRASALMTGIGLVLLLPTQVEATCSDPADDTYVDTATFSGFALSASSPHPTLLRNVMAEDSDVQIVDLENFSSSSSFSATGTVTNSPNTVLTEEGTYGVFIATTDGFVERWDPEGGLATPEWSVDIKRGGCGTDSISGTPVVHLRRFATESFQSAYPTDLVYVSTRLSSLCAGDSDEDNQIIALRADTGAIEWTFNEDVMGVYPMDIDVIYESPFLDQEEDRLIMASDRNDPGQDSLWSIDVLTGTKAWSVNVGPAWTTPVVRDSTIYIGTTAGEIKAISKSDGATLWTVSNGGTPITTNIFPEFRPPYDDLIASVDTKGAVWLVRDDTYYGSSVWTVSSLEDPDDMIPPGTTASSRVGIDAENGKLYVGAQDGQIYQLSIVDGSVEATREVDSAVTGQTVGDVSFVFEGTDINMIAGSGNGELKKFCGPFAAEVYMSPATVAGSANVLANPGACNIPSDCYNSNPMATACSNWDCINQVCVAVPVADGTPCDDGNNNTSTPAGDQGECNGGVCLGYNDCKLNDNSCRCGDDTGTPGQRSLLEVETTCAPLGGFGETWCGTEVSSTISPTRCFAIGSGAESTVWVQLFDSDRRPFDITASTTIGQESDVVMSIVGGNPSTSGSPPHFFDPNSGGTIAGPARLSDGNVFKGSRAGTYYATIVPQNTGMPEESQMAPKWRVDVHTKHYAQGQHCVDTTQAQPLRGSDFKIGQATFSACPLDSNRDSGNYLKVTVREDSMSGPLIANAEVQVGYATDKRFAANYEEVIQDNPSLPNFGTTGSSTQPPLGVIEFNDHGNYMNGPLYVFATCPGGTIFDARTRPLFDDTRPTYDQCPGTSCVTVPPVRPPVSSSETTIILDCN